MLSRKRRMVIAHHIIWTGYGWWLPNDPRGSTSTWVGGDLIKDLGELHFGRREIQPAGWEIRKFYSRAIEVLKHRQLTFQEEHRQILAKSFQEVIERENYTCYAWVIMPDHIHGLIRKHKDTAEEMIKKFQDHSRLRLSSFSPRYQDHPVWAQGGWKVFLDSPEDIRRTMKYINDNPLKLRLPVQNWPFVKEYDNWPFHKGHNPNSPYARRMRGEE